MNPMDKSLQIYRDAVAQYKPKAIVAMVSGGKDSALMYKVAMDVGIPLDAVMHINTRTGIRETSEYVRATFPNLLEADAGDAYERYVRRKGFFGRGLKGHSYAYHLLKADPLRAAISREYRKKRRNYNVLLLNGRRKDEGDNRMGRSMEYVDADPAAPSNLWCSIVQDWTADDRDAYLGDFPINPVAKALCRSGECMCGTMQSHGDRVEASIIYPEWGKWLDNLESEVMEKFPWKWGQVPTHSHFNGQMDLFQPMCHDCTKEDR